MAEVGQVIENKGNLVVVQLERHDACGKCRACVAGMESKEMYLEAFNECNAEVGDLVTVSLEQSNFLKAVLIMYVIPLIALLVGIGAGYWIIGSELGAVIVGLVFLAISFFIIHMNEEAFRKAKYRPIADTIVKKLS